MVERILWLSGPFGVSDSMKMVLNPLLGKHGISMAQIYFTNVSADPEKLIKEWVDKINPAMIICNDLKALEVIAGKGSTLNQCRGSVYEYAGKNVIVFDELKNLFATSHGRWVTLQDIDKLGRWVKGKQRPQPRFEYKVVKDIHDVLDAKVFLCDCVAIATDIETHPGRITVIGYTGLSKTGKVFTYVFPFFNPFNHRNVYWPNEDTEIAVWECIKEINASPAVKIMQNGASYDSAYFISHSVPLANYTTDTMHLFHSIWTEAPKKLNFISSICLDFCRFWKDEAKGDDKKAEHQGRFKTIEQLEKYWRYNALDCYNTLCNAVFLVRFIRQIPWALDNYKKEFAIQVGPALSMTMQGLRGDQDILDTKKLLLEKTYNKELSDLRIMADDAEFNPNSPDQVSHLLYKTLGARMPKLRGKSAKLKEGTTDESVLKMLCNQHPLLMHYIEKIWAVKKPRNNMSKYCKELPHGRFYFTMSSAGTETGRFSAYKHPFNFGTNVQNVPGSMRDFVIADEGYVLFEPDYSQSDARFVAYESQDLTYIKNVESGLDTHCLHAAHFFKPRTYDEIYNGVKAGDPLYAHEVTGIRQITKRIVHGKNYNMAGFTLYMLMGKTATIAAARVLGFNDADTWPDERFASFCQTLLNSYDKLYPRLKPWQEEEMVKGKKNGNKITCSGGRTRLFFGDLLSDKATQREAIAYFGQGGTAGNINDTILKYYYSTDYSNHIQLLTQTHDSMLFQLPIDNYHYWAEKILTLMDNEITIHGRTFKVPTDGKVGFAWGKGLVKYKKSVTTIEEMQAAKDKLVKEYERIKEDTGEDAELFRMMREIMEEAA